MGSGTPVLWVGENIDRIAGWDRAPTAEFVARYGWNPHESRVVPSATVPSLGYKGRDVARDPQAAANSSVAAPVTPSAMRVARGRRVVEKVVVMASLPGGCGADLPAPGGS